MLRLTLLLCIGMFAALMIAGEDRGQMRPGLAAAASRTAAPEAVSGVESAPAQLAEAPPATEPALEAPGAVVVEAAAAAPEPTVAAATPVAPAPYVEPERKLVVALEEPIFSLAAVGNETPPAAPAAPQPETLAGGEGTIWYVTARSVNVRAEPSTEAEVVGRLGSGEATLMVQAVNDEWARIVIQGDGVEGFVAMRYLSAEAP